MHHEVDIIDSIYERIEADGFDALTDAERYYFALWWLEGETNNGTFHQYFHNSSGDFAYDALAGLKAVGAHQMAALFQAAIALFPNGQVPKDQQQRQQLLDAFTPAQNEKLDQLSDAFTDYPDDLGRLLAVYVQEHAADFRGPKSLLERWHMRRARGADTRPPSVNPENLEKWLEEDARVATRLCPACGQPCPDWRIECRRCDYPLRRAKKT